MKDEQENTQLVVETGFDYLILCVRDKSNIEPLQKPLAQVLWYFPISWSVSRWREVKMFLCFLRWLLWKCCHKLKVFSSINKIFRKLFQSPERENFNINHLSWVKKLKRNKLWHSWCFESFVFWCMAIEMWTLKFWRKFSVLFKDLKSKFFMILLTSKKFTREYKLARAKGSFLLSHIDWICEPAWKNWKINYLFIFCFITRIARCKFFDVNKQWFILLNLQQHRIFKLIQIHSLSFRWCIICLFIFLKSIE